MRVIICGAGQVGYNIASYLAREDNDVTVVDCDRHLIERVNDELDVNALLGHASDPEVLSMAGASDADLIVAVTDQDEVNMVACQVAHSLFGVPKKIARIREQSYLNPAWSNLFSRAHMPIDVIISPEIEVARSINQRLRIPGTTSVVSLAEGKVYLVGVICKDDCPVVNTQLKQLHQTFPDLNFEISAILREGQPLVPGSDDQLQVDDEVFFFTVSEHLHRALAIFGHEEERARQITVVGGGNIGISLVKLLQQDHDNIQIKVIEKNEATAKEVSKILQDVIVIHGDALNHEIMKEANIARTDTLISLTDDDETNILASLLAKQHGCERVIALVNNTTYAVLTNSLGIDVTVSPRSSTVSTIMQHVRRGRIKALHTLRDGFAEIIEAEVSDTISIANVAIRDIKLPQGVVIGMLVREDKVINPPSDFVVRPGDHIILLAAGGQARKVEKMFSVQIDLF
ncbi:MAG: Trk system potassium transporter TrkA [Rhodospirillales bacterium]|nr:Trk system potassium transporter TrkA [Rhodospirillales bacterium]